jgi:hypothetical protein
MAVASGHQQHFKKDKTRKEKDKTKTNLIQGKHIKKTIQDKDKATKTSQGKGKIKDKSNTSREPSQEACQHADPDENWPWRWRTPVTEKFFLTKSQDKTTTRQDNHKAIHSKKRPPQDKTLDTTNLHKTEDKIRQT